MLSTRKGLLRAPSNPCLNTSRNQQCPKPRFWGDFWQFPGQPLHLCLRDKLVDLLAGVEGSHLHLGHPPLRPPRRLQVLVMLLQDLAESSEVQVLQARERTCWLLNPSQLLNPSHLPRKRNGSLPSASNKGIVNENQSLMGIKMIAFLVRKFLSSYFIIMNI